MMCADRVGLSKETAYDSELLGELKKGDVGQISEVFLDKRNCRVRGLLADGKGWITIKIYTSGSSKLFAFPWIPGDYKISVEKASVTNGVHLDSNIKRMLKKNDVVQITEVRHLKDDCRVRGLVRDVGWMTLLNYMKGESKLFAKRTKLFVP